jgi:transcriptional regulator GlxA family with amidase domain
VRVAAPRVEPLVTGSGYAIAPEVALAHVDLDRVDTLVVAGGEGTRAAVADEGLVAWLTAAAPRVRRVASVCTGAFLLARAGLLDGRRATTHWAWCDELARRFPAVAVEPDPIFVADGPFRTSAGVTAGMDLALSLVEEDLGPRAALRVARELVLFVRRPGGQSQFSAGLAAQAAQHAPLRELQAWIADHLDEDLSVPALARRAHMTERSFARACPPPRRRPRRLPPSLRSLR